MHAIDTSVVRDRSYENLAYEVSQHKNFQINGILCYIYMMYYDMTV